MLYGSCVGGNAAVYESPPLRHKKLNKQTIKKQSKHNIKKVQENKTKPSTVRHKHYSAKSKLRK